MSVRLVVLDFDGTFTDSEAEGAPFAAAFPYVLAWRQQAPSELVEQWSEAVRWVAAQSPEEGWFMNGKHAAPADADPYIRCSMAGLRLLRQLQIGGDDAARGAILNATYAEAYRHSAIVFRPHATESLDRIVAAADRVVVVTNSRTDHVAHKVDQLGLRQRDKVTVVGNAMKFWVDPAEVSDPRFAALDEVQRFAGLQRPVWLKRSRYFQILDRLWTESGTSPDETLVCGDIYELDLALPGQLGARIALMQRANTYAYERDAVAAMGDRGLVVEDLRAVADWVERS
jgi:FMN phosphatase YigB (HAD superfamily)